MNNLDAIYLDVDEFCLLFEPQWLKHLIESGEKQRIKPSRLFSSEVMTILIAFHQSGVCHNMRIPRNHVFAGEAKRGKGSMGWFYGFKLHLIIMMKGVY